MISLLRPSIAQQYVQICLCPQTELLPGTSLRMVLWVDMMIAEISKSDQPTEARRSPDGLILSLFRQPATIAVLLSSSLA